MSVASVYVRVKYSNERYKSFAYRIGPSHVQLIYVHSHRQDRTTMAPKEQKKGSDAEEIKKSESGLKLKALGGRSDEHPQGQKPKKKWKLIVAQIAYTVLAVLTAIVAVGVIVLSLLTVVIMQLYTTDQSGHVAGLVVVLVTAFVAIAVLVYALVTVFKKKPKGLFVASLLLLVLAVVQVSLAGAVVHLSVSEETSLSKSLHKVYSLSRSNEMKFVKQFHLVETSAKCCGYEGANDYRLPNVYPTFPPDVPISCCPSYDPDKSDFAQEKAREVCRQNRIYYSRGCSIPVLEELQVMSEGLMTVLVTEAVLELILVALGLLAYFLKKKLEKSHEDHNHS